MNEQEFKTRFPNASRDTIALNTRPRLPAAEPQPAAQTPLDDSLPREAARHSRVALGYHARVVRPLDPDNLAGSTKYVTDALVRCGLLDGDSPEQIAITWTQEKVVRYDDEALIITISGPQKDRSRSAATDESAAKNQKQKDEK